MLYYSQKHLRIVLITMKQTLWNSYVNTFAHLFTFFLLYFNSSEIGMCLTISSCHSPGIAVARYGSNLVSAVLSLQLSQVRSRHYVC